MTRAGARSSPLSRAQVEEIEREFQVKFDTVWIETTGDRDKVTSLRSLDKSDFFTRELDQMLLRGEIQVAIHSAKDLPDPIPKGLKVIAMTKGIDSRDVVVLREGESLAARAVVATSSLRREKAVRTLFPTVRFVDLRGNIGERLAKIEQKEVDGVVVAEAALIRLKLTYLNRIYLPGETAPLQGRLAVVARESDFAVESKFECIEKTEIK